MAVVRSGQTRLIHPPSLNFRKMHQNEFIGITTLLYALANPVGVVPIFLGLTRGLAARTPLKIIAVACLAVAAFLSAAALLGRDVLAFFNVGLDDFRIAGGLFALFIAFEMFQAHYGGFMQTSEERREAASDVRTIAITPLAFPLLVGPAEMGVMITLANDATDWQGKAVLVASAVTTAGLVGLTLFLAIPIDRVLGRTGINVATRVMALFVAAIGVHFILTGLRSQLPGLAS
jgi:multiple antibiotic resistance protein